MPANSLHASFTAVDNSVLFTKWNWDFGDNAFQYTQNATHIYNANGAYKSKVFATAANTGCYNGKLDRTLLFMALVHLQETQPADCNRPACNATCKWRIKLHIDPAIC